MSTTEHLSTNRRIILSRALLAGAAGMLPVPYLDDLLAGAVRAALIRRLAEIRQVDVDANAIDALAHPYASRLLNAASAGAIAIGGTRRIVRRLAVGFLLVRRVDEAVQTFHLGTLFDHYCAQRHVGVGLDGRRALILRETMEVAIRKTKSESLARAFKKGLRAMGAAAMQMPRGAFSLLAKLRGSAGKGHNVETFDDRINAAASSPFVRRAAENVDAEVEKLDRSYLETLLVSFDRAWEVAIQDRTA
jgi:uncharacterized protein (DUF697 family)